MNTCPLVAGKEIRDAVKTVFCSRLFSIRSLIFYHVNGGRRFFRKVYGPLPRCMTLDHNSILLINSNSKTSLSKLCLLQPVSKREYSPERTTVVDGTQ
jgi:hypothetical protein